MIDDLRSATPTTGRYANRTVTFSLVLLLVLVMIDRAFTLFHFGFIYTDIDQTVLWNGVLNYSHGIFHEPFFYGQPYNYMLEALLATPLYLTGMPVYMALPIITSFLSIFPFLVVAIFFFQRKHYFYAGLALALPTLLPVEYNFLTTLSRGFVQAMLFIPLMFPAIFQPQNKQFTVLLYLGAALALIANTSSALLVIPVFLYIYSFHTNSTSFYLKALLTVPIFTQDYFARQFYHSHPERMIHPAPTLNLSVDTFIENLLRPDHFEHLFPWISSWGILYPFLFLALTILSFYNSNPKSGWFNLLILFLLLATLAIPKVQERHEAVGFFFTPSRLYLSLPLLFIISLFLTINKFSISRWATPLLAGLALLHLPIKNHDIKNTVSMHLEGNYFPVAKNQELNARAKQLQKIALAHEVELIVNANLTEYNYVFDSYAYNPLMRTLPEKGPACINLNGDRRTWLYHFAIPPRRILLNGFEIDRPRLLQHQYQDINPRQVLIFQNNLPPDELFESLGYNFGI